MRDQNFWKLNKGWIEFILLAAPPDELETMTGPIFDLAIEHEAEVDLMGSLVVITYGTSGVDTGIRGKRFPPIEKLTAKIREPHQAGSRSRFWSLWFRRDSERRALYFSTSAIRRGARLLGRLGVGRNPGIAPSKAGW